MLLITGCGRSGTHFTSRLLREMGLDVPHERVGKDGVASWKHIVSGTFVYLRKNREAEIDSTGFDRILHQVRHPLKVISSMQTFSDSTWHHMAKFIDLDLKAKPVKRAMQAWVHWNRLVESKAHWRFQIEQLQDRFEEFCQQAGLPVQLMPHVPHEARDSRKARFRPVDWQELKKCDPDLAEEVRQLAVAYGYEDIGAEIPSPPPRRIRFWRRFFNGRDEWPSLRSF
jgi:hypothetical protein